jgi:hypothetical protein
MLYFKDGTKKFIREYRFIEYYSILKNKNDWNVILFILKYILTVL